jgi:hypothetical protein
MTLNLTTPEEKGRLEAGGGEPRSRGVQTTKFRDSRRNDAVLQSEREQGAKKINNLTDNIFLNPSPSDPCPKPSARTFPLTERRCTCKDSGLTGLAARP